MMKCQNCGYENLEDSTFCEQCGKKLASFSYCKKCGAKIAHNVKFCSQCGYLNSSYFDGKETLSKNVSLGDFNDKTVGRTLMGDKNVIGGDVTLSTQDTYNVVNHNTTIVNNIDESKMVLQCGCCGSHVIASEGYNCPHCGGFVCKDCYSIDKKMCNKCVQTKKKENLSKYKQLVEQVLSDGRIEVEEQKMLEKAQVQLEISSVIASQIQERVIALKNQGNTANGLSVSENSILKKAEEYDNKYTSFMDRRKSFSEHIRVSK